MYVKRQKVLRGRIPAAFPTKVADFPFNISLAFRRDEYIVVIVTQQYNVEQLMSELRERVSKSTQVAVAAELGVSFQHVNDLLAGRRNMSERVAGAMGYTREIVFRKKAA